MKQGQVLHGYLIVSKPTNDGAGRSLWARAERAGHEYFVKEFLEPKRPRQSSMGSAEAKQKLREQCREFERRHWSVIGRIDPGDVDAGNLVIPVDFFYDGTRYYKVTPLLHPAEVASPHKLSPRQKAALLASLAGSLKLLHRLHIVHGDLKPQNVLLYQPAGTELFIARLIDFDDAFVSGQPPAREAIGGDARFGAPELLRYVQGDLRTPAKHLTIAADLFAFGLMVHSYLTGALPGHDASCGSPAEAVNAGRPLRLDGRLHPRVLQAVGALLSLRPADRPAVAEVAAVLAEESVLALDPDPDPAPTRTAIAAGASAALRRAVPVLAMPATQRRSRVRINLNGRRPAGSGSREGHEG